MSNPEYHPPRKVVPSDEMDLLLDVSGYAQAAQEIYRAAKTKAEASEKEAREQGYNEGFSAGRAEALQSFASELGDLRARLIWSEEDIVQLVVSGAERIIGALENGELARRIVGEALHDFADERTIVLRVPPEERGAITEEIGKWVGEGAFQSIRAIEPEALLKPGEMILETSYGRFHIGARNQLRRLADGLRRNEA